MLIVEFDEETLEPTGVVVVGSNLLDSLGLCELLDKASQQLAENLSFPIRQVKEIGYTV